jgi:N-carbamoylputrescine amidase
MAKIKIAIIQTKSSLGEVKTNLDHFTILIEKAAQKGAKLIVLPELAASGYSLSKILWDSAETREGLTVNWLRQLSIKLKIYLGIGFVETDGQNFFDTYAFADPDGKVSFIRKTMAETAFFRSSDDSHIINTPIGKIGIGICADNHFVPFIHKMQLASPDILLMPHAFPGPSKKGGVVSQQDIDGIHLKAKNLPLLYVHFLGIPVIFVNHVGPIGKEKWSGLLGKFMNPDNTKFLGLSRIVDRDGTIKTEMDDQTENFFIAEINLDSSKKVHIKPVKYGNYGGGWVDAGTSGNFGRDLICYIDSFIGRLSYTFSKERQQKAKAMYERHF